MFGGILSKILLGVIAVLVLSNGYTYVKYNWFSKPAYEKEIRELQEAGIKAQADKFRLEGEVDFLKNQKKAQEGKVRVKTKLHETIQEPTSDNFVEYTRRFRVQPNDKNPPKSRKAAGGTQD